MKRVMRFCIGGIILGYFLGGFLVECVWANSPNDPVTVDSSEAEDSDSGESSEESDEDGSEDDENEEIDEEEAADMVEIEAFVGTQSVLSGSVPINVYVTPHIDSNRAEITWDLPRGLDSESDTNLWFEMQEGEGRNFALNVIPEKAGKYKVVVEVTVWHYDTNYVVSDWVEFEIDENLAVTPATEEYERNKMMLNFAKIAGVIVVTGLVVGSGIIGFKKFKIWMAKD